MIDPMMITPWIAFAPLINGVCKTDGTLDITSIPKKIDRITTYSNSRLLWMKLSNVSMNKVLFDEWRNNFSVMGYTGIVDNFIGKVYLKVSLLTDKKLQKIQHISAV